MSVTRRNLLLAAGLGGLPPWLAAQAVPEALYVEGRVTALAWTDPQPYLVIAHVPKPLPKGALQERRMRPSAEPLALRGLLDRVIGVPDRAAAWRVHLPRVAQLTKWGMPRPQVGQALAVLGAGIPAVGDMPTLSAQVVFYPDIGYPVLFDPA